MKTLLLKDSSLRVSVMSFHHEIVYSVMRAYFEALVSHVLIWNERSYGLLWNTEMVEDIAERLRFFSKDTKRWRVYAVLFGVINLRRELRIVPFRDALEEHMSTGLNVSAVAVIDVHRIYETFGTKNVPEDVLEDFVNKYNAWHNSFEWFVRLFENGRLKSENRVCRTMDDVIMWLKHQPELVNVRITPKQFADARADVESDFGILVKKNFVLTGINALNRLEFRDGAMALRVAFDDLVRVHSELHDPESIGSVFWSADSVVAAMAGVVPRKVRPSSPKVMVANTGSVVLSTAASTAALASSRSAMVSTTMRSQPAASAARACSEKMSKASSKVRVPKGSSSAPVGPMSPATSGAPATRALAAAAAYTSATVAPAFASFKRLVLNVLVVMQSAPASTYWR